MNKRQKIVQQAFLDDEEKVINKLKNQYSHSLKEITAKSNALQKDIEKLAAMYENVEDEEEKARLQSMQRSKVYQKKYQDSLKKQVSDILDNMHENEFKTVSAYLNKCYEQGFLGTMYDLQGQGIPLCFPLDQEAMVRAIQLDSKISQGLYNRLGEDVSLLKKKITAQVSRGISTGMSYGQVAQQLAGTTNIGFNNAVRIARTEGHRIQCQSTMDACYKAKDKGADIVKQWDSTMDSATRESHVAVDGEIRELDKPFSNGLMFPSDPSGAAAEVVNCRCALLQRARWAVGDSFTKMNNETKEIVDFKDIDDYNEFKKQYFSAAKNQELRNFDITENGKYKVLPYDDVENYKNYIRTEYYAQRLTSADHSVLWAEDGGYIQNADGYKDINGYMRKLKDKLDNPKCQKTMDVLIKRTSVPALKHDYVGFRKVQPSYLQDVLGLNIRGKIKAAGLPWEGFKDKKTAQQLSDAINGLVGTKKAFVTDEAVTSVSLCEKINFFKHRTVKFEIQMPSGTRGLITDNYKESEFIAKPKTTLEILGSKVYNEDGKSCIKIFARMIQG